MRRHIALTGFMAAGKSTIGKKLARRLEVKFYDLDHLIVARHGAIADIFTRQGEAQFRRYEYEALSGIIEAGDAGVIALGGGAVTYDPTLALLKKRTHRVFIKAALEQMVRRLRASQAIRPLLGPAPTIAKIKALYERRLERYAHADLVVEAEEMSPAQVVEHIVQWLHRRKIEL